jgi:hypothetical protein
MEPMSSFTRRTKEPRMYWNRAPDILLSLSLSLSLSLAAKGNGEGFKVIHNS